MHGLLVGTPHLEIIKAGTRSLLWPMAFKGKFRCEFCPFKGRKIHNMEWK